MQKRGLFTNVLFLFLFLFLSIHPYAAPPLEARAPVVSKLASAESAVKKIYLSEKYPSPHPQVLTGAKLLDVEIKALWDFIGGPGDPKQKTIYLLRYEIGSLEVADAIIAAHQKGIRVQIITDLNTAYHYRGTVTTTDFESQTLSDSYTAQFIKKMKTAGAKLNDPDFGYYSQPLNPRSDDDEKNKPQPIMHEKTLLFVDKNIGIENPFVFHTHGTNNMTDNPRINSMMEFVAPELQLEYYNHIQRVIETFGSGRGIKDIPSLAPLRVKFQDTQTEKEGSFIELGFTDGKYNLNDRLTELIKEGEIKEVLLNEFVVTYTPFMETLVARHKEALTAGNPFFIRVLGDDSFAKQGGPGLLPILDGFDVYRKFGKPIYGVGWEADKYTQVHVYQSPAIDPKTGVERIEDTEEGPPIARKLNHNKIAIVDKIENGEEWSYVFFGSFNLSSASRNAEAQALFRLRSHSWIVQALKNDVKEIIRTQPEYAVEGPLAFLRQGIAKVVGNTDLKIPLPLVTETKQALLDRNYAKVIEHFKAASTIPSLLHKKPSAAEVETRIEKIKIFFDWYQKTLPSSSLGQEMRIRKMNMFFLLIANPKAPAWQIEKSLRSVIWRPNMDQDKVNESINEAWTLLGLAGEAPYKSRDKESESPDKKVAPIRKKTKASINFDIDGNILKLPTKIVLFEKGTGKELPIPNLTFTQEAEHIGKEGAYKNYEIIRGQDSSKGSFRYFRDYPDRKYIIDDFLWAVENQKPEEWQGPAFYALVLALSHPDSAKDVQIITARGNAPESVLVVFQLLQKSGYIQYLPELKNIHCVGNTENPAEAKFKILEETLEEQSQKGEKVIMTFSDDDPKNYNTTVSRFTHSLQEHPDANVEVVIFNTGKTSSPGIYQGKQIFGGGKSNDIVSYIPRSVEDLYSPCENSLK